MDGYFTELDTPITYPMGLYNEVMEAWLETNMLQEIPPLTHWQLCHFDFEFMDTGIEAYSRAWLGLVYFSEDVKYKPPIPGKVIKLTGDELSNFATSPIGEINTFIDIQKEMMEYLVDNGHLDGTVVLVEGYSS